MHAMFPATNVRGHHGIATQPLNHRDRPLKGEGATASQRSMMAELDEIKEQLGNVTGFRKEIDHALGRIAVIEKKIAG
jgi:hypothetical protein